MSNDTIKDIGDIGNYYGRLSVMKSDDKYYWGIEDWGGTEWEEIPKSLYLALIEFEEQRETLTTEIKT